MQPESDAASMSTGDIKITLSKQADMLGKDCRSSQYSHHGAVQRMLHSQKTETCWLLPRVLAVPAVGAASPLDAHASAAWRPRLAGSRCLC